MLSGDSLVHVAAFDPFQDALHDSMQQVVQHAELLETNAQIEEQLPIAEQGIYEPILTLPGDDNANVPYEEIVDARLSEGDENPQEKSTSDVGIALVLGVDLLDRNEVESTGEDVDSQSIEGCHRQLIMEQLTETLRVPHGPPDADGVLASLDDLQLEYVDAGEQIDLAIRLNTQNSTVIEVFDNNEGGVLASYSLSEISSLTVIGGDNSNDTLTVDLGNPFSIPGGIVFAGGDGGYDKLVLIGNSELTAEYFGDGDDNGMVIASGEDGQATNVSYSGLESFVYLNEFESVIIAENEILSGSGVYAGDLINYGTISPGNSPGIIEINGDLTIVGTDTDTIDDSYPTPTGTDTVGTIQIEIADNGEDPVGPVPGTDFDQIIVNGDLTLGGTLEIVLLDDFIPDEGDTFDILTFDGTVGGAFDNATGLFGFGDSSLFFDVEVLSDRVRLVVKEAPGADNIISSTQEINDVLGQFYSDYFTIDSLEPVAGELTIDDFVTLSGSFSFGVATTEVTVATGLPADATELFDDFGPTITGVNMLTLTIGAANVHAFVGLNGPYWTGDVDEYGNPLDLNETNPDAIGLSVTNLDIGFVLMKPLDPEWAAHPLALFYSLKATADTFEFVGWDEIILSAQQIEINVNNGVPWPGGLGTPVVDFATSYPAGTGDPLGLEVSTGGDPVSIDFGGKKVGFSSERITVQLSQFVHITGSFAFEKGPATSVDIATGLPTDATEALALLGSMIDPDIGDALADALGVIEDVQVSTFQIGASNVHAFVGLNGPYWEDDLDGDGNIDTADEDLNGNGLLDDGEDLDGDGNLDVDETNPEAVGLVVNDLDIGFVTMALSMRWV